MTNISTGLAAAWQQVREREFAHPAWPPDPRSYDITWLERHYTPIKSSYAAICPGATVVVSVPCLDGFIVPVAITGRATLRRSGETTTARIFQAEIRGCIQMDWVNEAGDTPRLATHWLDTADMDPACGMGYPLRWGLATEVFQHAPLRVTLGNPAEDADDEIAVELTLYVQWYARYPIWAARLGIDRASCPRPRDSNAWPSLPVPQIETEPEPNDATRNADARVTDRAPGSGLTYLGLIEHLKAQVTAIDNERLHLHRKSSALEERVAAREAELRALGAEPGTV